MQSECSRNWLNLPLLPVSLGQHSKLSSPYLACTQCLAKKHNSRWFTAITGKVSRKLSFARFDGVAPWLLRQYKEQNPAVYLIPLCSAIWDSKTFHGIGMSPRILEILLFIQEPSLTCKGVLDLLFYSLLSGHAIKTTTKIWVFCSAWQPFRLV